LPLPVFRSSLGRYCCVFLPTTVAPGVSALTSIYIVGDNNNNDGLNTNTVNSRRTITYIGEIQCCIDRDKN
jgi:hypothetical protein